MFAPILVLQLLASAAPADPFVFFGPSITVTAEERQRLDRGEALARVLPGDGLEVAVFAAVPVGVDGDRLVGWMRRIEALKKSRYVLAIRRFSDPPVLADLASLSLEDDELTDALACEPGRCALKLSTLEMAALRHAAAAGGAAWKPAVQDGFRRIVLDRVRAYLADGRVAPYQDGEEVVWPAQRFAALLDHSPYLLQKTPGFARHLRGYPQTAAPGVESFLYWSKERLAGKPIVSVTHVNILRGREPGLPDALVAGKEIFATHYINASLGLTALVEDAATGCAYLVYINRSDVDALGGTFGGLVRFFMQRRLRADAATVLAGLRQRLEHGPPDP